jgi:hypothetical protein
MISGDGGSLRGKLEGEASMTMTKAKVVRRIAALLAIALYIALSAWASACLDLTPVTAGEVVTIPIPIPDVQPPPRMDASIHRDASADGDAAPVDGAPVDGRPVDGGHDVYVPPCLACIAAPDKPGPGCATEFAECMADPQCELAYKCVIANGCFLVETRQEIVICATPCIVEAGGITSQFSTSGILVKAAATCATDPPPGCGNFCAPTD